MPLRTELMAPEFAWRTLRLLNGVRLLYSALLFAMFIYPTTPRLVGDAHPDLFLATVLAAFVWAAVNDFAVNQHWPSIQTQGIAQGLFDIGAIVLLAWASGGLGSGVANRLIITVTALAMITSRMRGLAFAPSPRWRSWPCRPMGSPSASPAPARAPPRACSAAC